VGDFRRCIMETPLVILHSLSHSDEYSSERVQEHLGILGPDFTLSGHTYQVGPKISHFFHQRPGSS